MKEYIQPFERILALRELKALANATPSPKPNNGSPPVVYSVRTKRSPTELSDALTYWERISSGSGFNEFTRQVRRESTARGFQKAERHQLSLTFGGNQALTKPPKRRVLRYGPHGIHEYRGKFFPQLVRSLLNLTGIEPGAAVFDPMCGSGTTLVEAVLANRWAIGFDLNPLSVLISRTKCSVLSLKPDTLAHNYEQLSTRIQRASRKRVSLQWLKSLSSEDQVYIRRWFSRQALLRLDLLATKVHGIQDPVCRDLFRLCLSNILRRVSWQKEDDLRIRKDLASASALDPVDEFLSELKRTVLPILAFLYEVEGTDLGRFAVDQGDARSVTRLAPLAQLSNRVRAVITSPPYATALPYLDTDRLSLCYLKLLPRKAHRPLDHQMIGNREASNRLLDAYRTEYMQMREHLPSDVTSLIDDIDRLNASTRVGFRRRNLPPLLGRYFLDMRKVLCCISELLSPGAFAFVVIGNNHTIAGGKRVNIETDRLLGLVGQRAGLKLEDNIKMEMLISRDIFRTNSIRSETILCLRKPG